MFWFLAAIPLCAGNVVENDRLRVEVTRDGRLAVQDKATGLHWVQAEITGDPIRKSVNGYPVAGGQRQAIDPSKISQIQKFGKDVWRDHRGFAVAPMSFREMTVGFTPGGVIPHQTSQGNGEGRRSETK